MEMLQQKILYIMLITLFVFSFSSCGSREKQAKAVISLSAAASLTDAMEEASNLYEKKTGIAFELNFASSSTCARQIAQGMTSDLFISANYKWVDYLSGMYREDSRRIILRNSLVVVIPLQSDLALSKPEDLTEKSIGRIAMGDPSHVPAGIYGKEALEMTGIWNDVQDKIVGAMDVRAALSLASEGAVDCALVYRSDALIDDNVKIAYEFASHESPSIEYSSCLIGASDEAENFYSFLFGHEVSEIFRKYGFTPVGAGENA